ncbi:DEAD/DEAH box helicase, partial [Klebsiella pneumoniae]
TVLPAAKLANLNVRGYLSRTPLQAAALPAILAGKDVRVQEKTGSGKTAAFGLGLLQHIDPARFDAHGSSSALSRSASSACWPTARR